MGEHVTIEHQSTNIDAYLARPNGPPKAGIVVIQEIFGVNADIRATADWLAGEGYMALAPDLFWAQERNIDLNAEDPDDLQKAFALMTNYDADTGVHDIQAAIDYLRGQGCAKVGTIGFCLGGRMVYLAACRTNGDAHSSYYGVGIQDMLDAAADISAPTLIHIAERDEFVPAAAQAAIADGLAGHALVQVHVYPEQDHGFARNSGMHYDADAAGLAHQRTLELFEKALD